MRVAVLFLLLSPLAVYAEPHTIVQILNFHYVTSEGYAADLKDQAAQSLRGQVDQPIQPHPNEKEN